VPVRVPSLQERREDVDELATRFCARAVARHGLPNIVLSAQALRMLRAMEWPGNVRQLEHAVEAAVIRAAAQEHGQVEVAHLTAMPEAPPAAGASGALTFQEATRRFQADFVQKVLDDCDWHVSEAARRLDIARSHLYNLIRAFGLARLRP
jgi:Nif-specific regulatory protein